MEMKIRKTVNVKMDESLGYTMVFIKVDELKKESLMEAIKQETLRSLLPSVGREQIPEAYNECHVLTRWLDKGYLCYPAYKNYLSYRPYNCGPKYIKAIDSILDKVNRRVGNEFLRMCEDLTSQITDRLNAIAKNVAAAEAKKKAEQPAALDASSEKLKKAVEKLRRKDIIWANGNVYFQTSCHQVLDTYPMKFLWLSHRGLHSFPIVDIVIDPLMDGKLLLTLPDAMEGAQAEYWSLLIDLVGWDNVKNASDAVDVLYGALSKAEEGTEPEEKAERPVSTESSAPQEGQKETVWEPKQPGPKAMLKAAVEKLGRKDVTYEYGHVYYQLKKWPCGRSVPMTNLWIRKTGLDTSTIQFRCTSPLMNGKVLLNLPSEIAEAEDAYWAILDSVITPDIMQDIVEVQAAIRKAMDEDPATKGEKSQEPLYFQTQPYTGQASFVEDMRLLWQNNVRGVNMSSIEETVLNPLHKGKISLLNDLPEVAVEFGLKYCRFLKYWLHPITWAMFADTWNKIHPDTKV